MARNKVWGESSLLIWKRILCRLQWNCFIWHWNHIEQDRTAYNQVDISIVQTNHSQLAKGNFQWRKSQVAHVCISWPCSSVALQFLFPPSWTYAPNQVLKSALPTSPLLYWTCSGDINTEDICLGHLGAVSLRTVEDFSLNLTCLSESNSETTQVSVRKLDYRYFLVREIHLYVQVSGFENLVLCLLYMASGLQITVYCWMGIYFLILQNIVIFQLFYFIPK